MPCRDTGRPLLPPSTRFDHITIEAGFFSPASRIAIAEEDALKLKELFDDCNQCDDARDPHIMFTPAISYNVVFWGNRRESEWFAPTVNFGPGRELYEARCKHHGTQGKIIRILTPYMNRVDQIQAEEKADKEPVY
jgi:hypothetical protein